MLVLILEIRILCNTRVTKIYTSPDNYLHSGTLICKIGISPFFKILQNKKKKHYTLLCPIPFLCTYV